MKKYTITSEEYELMCDKLHSLENENSKLKGYIEGLEKQLTIPNVVGRSEQLSFTDGTMPPMGSKEFDCYHGLCKCKQDCKT